MASKDESETEEVQEEKLMQVRSRVVELHRKFERELDERIRRFEDAPQLQSTEARWLMMGQPLHDALKWSEELGRLINKAEALKIGGLRQRAAVWFETALDIATQLTGDEPPLGSGEAAASDEAAGSGATGSGEAAGSDKAAGSGAAADRETRGKKRRSPE